MFSKQDRVTIIAEIGIGWNSPDIRHRGDMHMALTLIEQAATVADFVKFQLYDPAKVFLPNTDGPHGEDTNKPLRDEAEGYKLTKADWTFLAHHIRQCGAEPMVSVFDHERLQWAEDTGVVAHKIASRTVMADPELCASVLALNKPTLISLGQWEPKDSVPYPHANAHYLRCVSSYPTEAEQIAELDMSFGNPHCGFSDHTRELRAAMFAISRGAWVIEKHFTWSTAAPGSDHAGAMDLQMLEGLRSFATQAVRMGSLK